jgi:hypothetical protein
MRSGTGFWSIYDAISTLFIVLPARVIWSVGQQVMTVVKVHPNWHNVSDYVTFTKMDHALLMWEWLRRDAAYQQFYIGKARATMQLESGVNVVQLTDDRAIHPWGLLFRGRPGAKRA